MLFRSPKILRGMAHIEYAWDARGHGWASEVTEEGWQGFRSELKKAKKILTDTEAITKDDPHVYTALLTICRGESAPPKESEEIFLKGTSIVKDYDSLYSKRTCDLLPRWGGRPGEVKAFAERAVDTTRDIRGEAMYAVVAAAACTYVGGEEFAAYGFEWSRLNEAFGDMLEQFPESTYYLNAYCLIACYYDVETARALFESIGNQWDKDVWYSEETFNRHKTQINAPGSEPIKAKVISPVDAPVSEVTFIPLKYVVAVAIGLLIILVVSIRIILGVVLKN